MAQTSLRVRCFVQYARYMCGRVGVGLRWIDMGGPKARTRPRTRIRRTGMARVAGLPQQTHSAGSCGPESGVALAACGEAADEFASAMSMKDGRLMRRCQRPCR